MNNEIPKGHYCYRLMSIDKNKGSIKVCHCPYWEKIKNGAYCHLLKVKSENYDADSLIWDSVKECDINIPEIDEADDI